MSSRDTIAINQNASTINDNSPEMLEGVVISGSWDADNATCQVLIGDTVGFESPVISEGISQPFLVTTTLAVPGIGHQYGPVGGERAQVWESQGSWFAKLEHGPDDSPKAPSGETHILHRSAANPSGVTYDSGVRLTNDGPTPSDKLGGTHVGENGALTQAKTKTGHIVEINDTAQHILVQTANQQTYTLYDAAGNVLSHVAPKIGVGDLYANIASNLTAARKSDLHDLAENLIKQTLQTFAPAMAAAAVAAGVPNAGAWKGIMDVANWVENISGIQPDIPICSAITRIA